MIETISLNAKQAAYLSRYCSVYRRSLVQNEAPSIRRNQAIRAAQTAQADFARTPLLLQMRKRLC